MTGAQRRWIFLAAMAGMAGLYLWGLAGLPGFGNYPGPYGDIINQIAVGQTKATGVVSADNFDYRGFDTLGEEFILFIAATGVSVVLRHLRDERRAGSAAQDPVLGEAPATSDAVRLACVLLTGPVMLYGWFLGSHAQTSPSGGFQGGVVLATAFIMIYLAGHYLIFRRTSPVGITEAVEAAGAGGFAAVGLAAIPMGLAYLTNFLPKGTMPGAVSSSGTIAVISFLVGVEVGAAFVLVAGEMLEQTLLRRQVAG